MDSWWTRTWIVEELVVSSSAVILFGGATIDWMTLINLNHNEVIFSYRLVKLSCAIWWFMTKTKLHLKSQIPHHYV